MHVVALVALCVYMPLVCKRLFLLCLCGVSTSLGDAGLPGRSAWLSHSACVSTARSHASIGAIYRPAVGLSGARVSLADFGGMFARNGALLF